MARSLAETFASLVMNGTALSILLIEDNPGDARLVEESLKYSDLPLLRFVHEERLGSGLERLSVEELDLVLLDLSLPDSSGLGTVRRTLEAAPGVAIVVLTGTDDDELAKEVVRAGAQDYLPKGEMDPHGLGRAIRYAIERKRRENERRSTEDAERSARADAERAAKDRERTLGIVAHDLRNPLSAIAMYASLLQDTNFEPEQRNRYLEGLIQSTVQMDQLIEDLMDATRIQAGALHLNVQPLVPEVILREAIQSHELAAQRRNLAIGYEAAPDLDRVAADPARLSRVFSNLVGNAIKFTEPGGSIRLRAERSQEGIRFSVADTGSGISKGDLPQVFDRFWQGNTGSTAGAGLGLAIVKGMIEAHGGRVWVESELRRGSTFYFTFPAFEEHRSEEVETVGENGGPPVAVPGQALGALPVTRVLLVDDHSAIRRGLLEILRGQAEIEVVGEASTGEEAIDKARELHPDLIAMDLVMPGIGGIEAIRRITQESSRIRVLALTADTEEESLLPVLEAGASGFVRKTKAAEELVAAIRTVGEGEVFIDPRGQRLLLRAYLEVEREKASDPLRLLSDQDREILRLVAEGYTSKEIGKKLFLATSTVDTYRSQLMRRLGLSHRSEVVRLALRAGLLAAEMTP
jgi:DNA-binding NarL/FixJ family response regulator